MATLHSHHQMVGATYSSYLVVFKVHGNAIRLIGDSPTTTKTITTTTTTTQPTYRLLCHEMSSRVQNDQSDGIQVFVLDKTTTPLNKNLFQVQQRDGRELNATDQAIFMTPPMDSNREPAFRFDIGLNVQDGERSCKPLGSAIVYLEPKFSTQGTSRLQIMAAHNKAPIGQLQVEYLIVTSPLAFNSQARRPEWLERYAQLDAGHRGAGSGCRADLQSQPMTENTVASFNYAARNGANACELDVMCTSDGVPVIYHNYQLNTSQPLQIDQLTLEQLRQLKHRSIHDKNCQHDKEVEELTGSVTNGVAAAAAAETQARQDTSQFPTLEEVLHQVDKSCALNIELKWAQILANGKSEAMHYREINDYVDRVLECIRKHENGRAIMLSTLNADIAILLRLKQIDYPVLFLTTGDDTRFNDPATKTIKSAIHFAQAFDMAGINPNARMLNEYLVRYAKERGLLVYAWGDIRSAQTVRELRNYGLDGVIYDKIDLIKPQD